MTDSERAAEIGGVLHARLSGIRFPLTPPLEREIRREVCEYADELKSLGLPPEHIVAAVKRAAKRAGISATLQSLATPMHLSGADKLLGDMVGWCIQRYYGPRPGTDGR